MIAISKMLSTQLIKVSDMEKMVSSDQMKKTKGFDKEMKTITKISSMSVNDIKEDITVLSSNEVNNIVKKKQSKKRNYEKSKFIVDEEESKSEESNKESAKESKKEEDINEEKKKTKKKKKMKFI